MTEPDMNAEEKKNTKDDHKKAKEPEAFYDVEKECKRITISSFEGLKELDRVYTANLHSLQRMEYLRKLNENTFGFDLTRQENILRKGEINIREDL